MSSKKELPSAPSNDDDRDVEEEKEEIEPSDVAAADSSSVEAATSSSAATKPIENKKPPTTPSAPTLEEIEREFPNPEPEIPNPEPAEAEPPIEPKEEPEKEEKHCGMSKRTIGIFMCLLLIIVILQSVMIGLLANRNKDDDGNANTDALDRDNTDLGPTEVPTEAPVDDTGSTDTTPAPTEEPTLPPPSEEPTLMPTPLRTEFVSISEDPNAFRLSQASACDDCVDVMPPLVEIPLGDDSTVQTITVSSNGFVNLECINIGGCATIDVLSMDLNPAISGDVHVLGITQAVSTRQSAQPILLDSLIISWEDVRVNGQPESVVNAQAILYAGTGIVDICWGTGSVQGETFRAGIWNARDSVYLPAKGPLFDADGFSSQFPSDTCQRFRLNGDEDELPGLSTRPSSPPYLPPPTGTNGPTLPPSGIPAFGTVYPGTFLYLNGRPFARRLQTISSCNDCSENVMVSWLPDLPPFDFRVSSDGYVSVNSVEVCGYDCVFIEVVSADLNPDHNGNVFFWDASVSANSTYASSRNKKRTVRQPPFVGVSEIPRYIISWENVTFAAEPSNSLVNGQLRLYSNGTLEMCWGPGSTGALTFTAGLSEAGVRYPVEGGPFQNGVAVNGEWPTNLCVALDPGSGGSPVEPPTVAPPPSTCVSTSGVCVTNYQELVEGLQGAGLGDTVAVCGDIFVPEQVWFRALNLTLCCSDSHRCSLSGGGSNQILGVAAPNFTIRGLAFREGNDSTGDGGGSIAYFAPGHHRIIQCQFSNSVSSESGGHIVVYGASAFTIENSIFESGGASRGGAVMFFGTPVITISGSYFSNNEAGRDGGAIAITLDGLDEALHSNITIFETLFESNFAIVGGAVNVLDTLPSTQINVLDSYFDNNDALRAGGAVTVWEEAILVFSGNNGNGNGASSGLCPDHFLPFSFDECRFVAENFMIPDGGFTPLPSSFPYFPPSSAPDYEPTRPPTPDFVPQSCVSNTGPCASNYVEMVEKLAEARIGATISVCGSIFVPEPLFIYTSNVTVCCNDTQRCSFNGGGGSNLVVERMAESVTLRGLAFNGGDAGAGGGGNVAISGRGHHRISHCFFSNGFATLGGNLIVENGSSVHIYNTIFESGNAVEGGGASITNVPLVTVEGSYFTANTADESGGGLLIRHTPFMSFSVEPLITIVETLFESNFAYIGGGFALESEVLSARLNVVDSYFDGNDALRLGGAGAITEAEELFVLFSGNDGEANGQSSGVRCPDFFVAIGGDLCRAVYEDFMLPDSATYEPTEAPTDYFRPTPPPLYLPTRPPTPITVPQSCTSTLGLCATSYREMIILFLESLPGYTISVCGSIYLPEPLILETSNITLCCNDTQRCSFDSGGGTGLIVRADSVSLRGIAFQGGRSDSAGGNVAVLGSGDHRIAHCLFSNGYAEDEGGNLMVSNANSVAISNSIFESGYATSGGGAMISNVPVVTVQDSYFTSNSASSYGGGGLMVSSINGDPDIEHQVTILSTLFESNEAIIGGGFFVEASERVDTRLVVLDSYFDSNDALRAGGAGAVSEESIAYFARNNGASNGLSGGLCPDYFFGNEREYCRAVNEDFMLPTGGTLAPAPAPSSYPVYVPTLPPVPVPAPQTCRSTTGRCASNYVELRETLEGAQIGETVSVCGSIFVPDPLIVRVSNLTICCNDTQRCSFDSGGSQNMIVERAESVTLRGLAFLNGLSEATSGGNVAIFGPGHHRISHCLFSNGNSLESGGNLMVSDANSIHISNSIFESGSAVTGGGAIILNTPLVTIEESYFISNNAEVLGGGLEVIMPSTFFEPILIISKTLFESNFAGIGGGFHVDSRTVTARLSVVASYFEDNDAFRSGGVGAADGEMTVSFSGNDGEGNGMSSGDCRDFLVSFARESCRFVYDDFVLVPNGITLPPTDPPTNYPTIPSSTPHYEPTPPPFYYPTTMSYTPHFEQSKSPTDYYPTTVSYAPHYEPTRPPFVSPDSCSPTIGSCAMDYMELVEQLIIAQRGDIVSVCGFMFIPEPVEIISPGVTLCCNSEDRCALQSSSGQVMVVNAADVSLVGISFEGGVAENGSGGNVAIYAPGSHHITECFFGKGIADNDGGLLFVSNADEVLVSNSIFDSGVASRGGGAMFLDTRSVRVEGSYFTGNSADFEGGGLLVAYSTPGPPSPPFATSVTIINTLFLFNTAGVGGGFHVSASLQSTHVSVLGCHFEFNVGLRDGGAGGVDGDANIFFAENSGEDNSGSSDGCPDFAFFLSSGEIAGDRICRGVSGEIIFGSPPTTAPYFSAGPSQTPVPIQTPDLASCSPTFDECAGSYEDFVIQIARVPPGGTVSICGSMEMGMPPPELLTSDVTVCCADNQMMCGLVSAGQQLIVRGSNVSIRGISFSGGLVTGANGGNVMIDAPGDHEIAQCAFSSGFSDQYGGNLYVGNANAIKISDTTFTLGSASWGGGGVAVDNTPNVSIEHSAFTRNEGQGGGGGVLIAYTTLSAEIPQATWIIDTSFDSNMARFGGGFLASGLGTLPNLLVLDSTFQGNTVDFGGAAGYVSEPSVVFLDANRGGDNVDSSPDMCNDFMIAVTNGFTCVGLDASYIS